MNSQCCLARERGLSRALFKTLRKFAILTWKYETWIFPALRGRGKLVSAAELLLTGWRTVNNLFKDAESGLRKAETKGQARWRWNLRGRSLYVWGVEYTDAEKSVDTHLKTKKTFRVAQRLSFNKTYEIWYNVSDKICKIQQGDRNI